MSTRPPPGRETVGSLRWKLSKHCTCGRGANIDYKDQVAKVGFTNVLCISCEALQEISRLDASESTIEAETREACAVICKAHAMGLRAKSRGFSYANQAVGADDCATAIRAAGSLAPSSKDEGG